MIIFHDLCVKYKLPSAEGLEFESLIDALEAHGLVKIVSSKSKIKQDDQVVKRRCFISNGLSYRKEMRV